VVESWSASTAASAGDGEHGGDNAAAQAPLLQGDSQMTFDAQKESISSSYSSSSSAHPSFASSPSPSPPGSHVGPHDDQRSPHTLIDNSLLLTC